MEIINRVKPTVPREQFVPFAAAPDGVPPLPSFGDGYRILHSINPHDEDGDIHWKPDVFEKLYQRITNKITSHYDDIVRTKSFSLDDARIGLVAYGSESRPALEAVKVHAGKRSESRFVEAVKPSGRYRNGKSNPWRTSVICSFQ